MVVLRSSAAGTGAGTGGLEERGGKENETGVGVGTKADTHKNSMSSGFAGDMETGIATADAASPATAAERKLLRKAELVAAEFDFPVERLNACVAEFVREMGVFCFIINAAVITFLPVRFEWAWKVAFRYDKITC